MYQNEKTRATAAMVALWAGIIITPIWLAVLGLAVLWSIGVV
jgi:hypothetical protein